MTRWFDVRTAGIIVLLWSIIVTIIMASIGFFDTPFFQFGPNEHVKFFSANVDTWGRWWTIVMYTIIDRFVQTYGLETITPFMLNEVQNRKVHHLKESDHAVLSIFGAWYVYMWTARIVSFQILLSQIDFLIIILLSDLLTTFITTKFYYLARKNKTMLLEEGLN